MTSLQIGRVVTRCSILEVFSVSKIPVVAQRQCPRTYSVSISSTQLTRIDSSKKQRTVSVTVATSPRSPFHRFGLSSSLWSCAWPSGSWMNIDRIASRHYSTLYCITVETPSAATLQPMFGCSDLKKSRNSPIGLKSSPLASTLPVRHYGRRVRTKPPKITYFGYSGDLRTLPELAEDTTLYQYKDLESEFAQDEKLRKLSSIEFASGPDKIAHKQELIVDRMIELFGPDSELEQAIALKTLSIRQMIPMCIKHRTNKRSKIVLLKLIFGRRNMLTKLRQLDHERFEWLLRELKIRYVIPRDREEYKGWKHNLRVATQDKALAGQRDKLEELKAQFEEEKKEFYAHKAKVLAEIDKDLEHFGLSREFLEQLLVKEKEQKKPHKILNWEERVRLGMTGKIKDYYG